MRKQYSSVVFLAVLFAAGVSGCAEAASPQESPNTLPSLDVSEFAGEKATLDYANQQIIFPIDAYFMSASDQQTVRSAFELEYAECMTSAGSAYEPDLSPSSVFPDRRYGLWNVEEAAAYGYGLPPGLMPDDGAVATSDMEMEMPPEQVAAAEKCADVVPLPVVERGALPGDDEDAAVYLPASIELKAYDLAKADARWATADDEWYACLEQAGYAVDRESLGPVVPSDEEGALRAAVAEATCSVDTSRVERLSSIESEYQAALISEQQAALNTSLDEQKKIVEEAQAIIDRLS